MISEKRTKRARRADAIDNEAKVRSGAMRVFTRRGHSITIDEVAAESGVSKGTVYATFPSRRALVDTMVLEFLQASEQKYRHALDKLPGWEALVEVVLTPTVGVATTAGMMDPEAPPGPVTDAQNRLIALLGEILEKGKLEATIRPEITPEHLVVLTRGLYQVLPEYSEENAQIRREYLAIILRGLHT